MEFDSAEFIGLTNTARIAKCRAFAAEAERLALDANGGAREGYLELAKKWSDLADEMAAAG